MSTRFPNELFELFVDEVANNTNRAHRASALKSCALASTSTSKRARSHLFSDISLQRRNVWGPILMKKRSKILKQLIESDPVLITFIRVFKVHIDNCNDEGIQEEYGLPAIITMLYSSPRSGLHSFSFSSCLTSWDSLPTAFRASLSNLCQSGSLKSLSLNHIHGIPLHLITKCHSNLQKLSLFNMGFSHPGFFPPLETGRTSLSRLEELHTDYSIIYLEQSLKTRATWDHPLELEGAARRCDKPGRLLENYPDLKQLVEGPAIPRNQWDTLGRIQIGLLPRLRSLSFQISRSDYYDWIPATRIFSCLRSSHSSTLTHLSIDLISTNPRWHSIHPGQAWDTLDTAIASPSFPALESVKIRLISPGLTSWPEIGGVDEARWDTSISVRDLSSVAMAWFPRTSQRMCGVPTMELKFLRLDYPGEGV